MIINFEHELAILHTMARRTKHFGCRIILLGVVQCMIIQTVQADLPDSLQGFSNKLLQDQIAAYRVQLANTDKQKQAKEYIELLKKTGTGFQRLGKSDSALYYYDRAMHLAESEGELALFSSLAYNLGMVYSSIGSYQKALDYALMALETDRKLSTPANIVASLNSVAIIYQEWGLYDKSLSYLLESLKYSEVSGNEIEIANGKYNLGNLYLKTGKTEKALECFQEAGEKYKNLYEDSPGDISLQQALSETQYSIGSVFVFQGEYEKALDQYRLALEAKLTISDLIGIGNCYDQMGMVHMLRKNYDEARRNYINALSYRAAADDKKGMALVKFRLGEINYQQSRFDVAENFFKNSILNAREIGDKEILQENYRLLYEIYKSREDYRQALSYHTLFKAYTDSLLNEHTTKIVEELNVRYETEQKEKENRILELTVQKQRSMGMYLVGVIILVLLILLILYILYRSKQKTNRIISHKNLLLEERNAQIANQKRVIETKNQDLTDSILYAKRIQDSMLMDTYKLNEVLDDAFIFFKPKDIVSGDFYWFGQKGDKFIFSAIDCTGHGVPGAFMSMLGNTFLNQIIHDQGITSPELILDALSREVQAGLKQAETNNQDGMDMALCTIDLKTKTVEYAGAKNPLIYIQNGEAVRIKADRLPIGISYAEDDHFHKHTLKPETPTCFYMFSDGYPDQFGGPEGTKFMQKQLQNLLLEIHKEPMARQKEILETTMADWMKDEEQIDDIIVVGFKLG